MLEDWHIALAAEADRRLVADGDGMHGEGQALVVQRQSGAPGKCAEAAVVAAAEVPQFPPAGLHRLYFTLHCTFNQPRYTPHEDGRQKTHAAPRPSGARSSAAG